MQSSKTIKPSNLVGNIKLLSEIKQNKNVFRQSVGKIRIF